MKRLILFFCFVGYLSSLTAQDLLPIVTISTAEFNFPDVIHIEYTIEDSDSDLFEVELLVSNDDGTTYSPALTSDITGDYGMVNSTGNKFLDYLVNPQGNEKYKLVVSDLYEFTIQDIVNSVDSVIVRSYMDALEGVRHWQANPEHMTATRKLVLEHLTEMGTDTSRQVFANSTTADGINLFGKKSGSSSDFQEYLVGGHYDTVEDSPGADDNATAVAGMMEIARVFKNYGFEKPIRFVSWDFEEAGIIGSSFFINNINPQLDIQAYLNFEMIGYYSDKPNTQSFPDGFELVFPEASAQVAADDYRGNFLTNVGNTENSFSLMQDFSTHANTYVPELKVVDVASPGSGLAVPDLLRSDHAAFWINGIPALMLTDASEFRNPNYHSPLDVTDSLSMEFMTNNIKAAVAYLAEEAGVNHATIVEVPISFNVSTNSLELANNISLYPQPAKELLTIDFGKKSTQDIQWKIYNLAGMLIDEGLFIKGKSEYLISLNKLKNGEFILNCNIESEIISRKFQVIGK